MSSALAGGIVGLVFGLLQFFALSKVADRLALDPKSANTARIIRAVTWFDLLLFPIIGYFLGPIVLPDGT